MRKLTLKEIKTILRPYPMADILIINRFLLTVHNHRSFAAAFDNLKRRARKFKWSRQTIQVIKHGIVFSAIK